MNNKKSQDILKKYKNKKILIMGLGLHGGGVGAAEFFTRAGAKVTATDLRTKRQLKESIEKLRGLKIKYVLGKHREEDFKNADLIIRNPAVPDNSPYLKIAKEHNVPIDIDIGIFFEACLRKNMDSTSSPQVIGITGTRGKSTTATLIYEFLKAKYKNVILAGNIRKSVLSVIPAQAGIYDVDSRLRGNDKKEGRNDKKEGRNDKKGNKYEKSFIVLELSSWQLEGLAKHKKSPHIAVITTIQPDHLNRYKGMGDYIKAKKLIFKFQNKNDILFLSEDDKIVKGFGKGAKAKLIFYGANEAKKYETNLLGGHNLANIAGAVKVAKYFGVTEKSIRSVLKKFRGLEGRLQEVAEVKGIKFINDTCATTPDATIAAIACGTHDISGVPPVINSSVKSKIYNLKFNNLILIAGGADKNLDFEKLAKVIAKKVKAVILLKGTATERLQQAIVCAGAQKPHPNPPLGKGREKRGVVIVTADSMLKAVKMAYNIAKKGDVVLLSPACASFGMFRHEFERGKKFTDAARSIKYQV
jgi:UDP-N-acetylmuramoylalanine--D-glutamate ligase